MDADYIVIDLGAGTAYNTIDFFLLADSQGLIVIPEPTSIENAYRLIENSFFRQVFHKSQGFELKSVVNEIMRKDNPHNINTPRELIDYFNKLGGKSTVFIEEQIKYFMPKLILNQVRNERDKMVGPAMKKACKKYFNLDVKFLGQISFDDSVRKSVLERQPLAVAYSNSEPMVQLKGILTDLLEDDKENSGNNSILSQLTL